MGILKTQLSCYFQNICGYLFVFLFFKDQDLEPTKTQYIACNQIEI